MKLQCINTDGLLPETLTVGIEYDIVQMYPGCYTVNGSSVYLSNFESIISRFKRLAINANKVILIAPTKGITVELLSTDEYIIVYAHTKGNHWNVLGNHYKYYHDIDTCEYLPQAREDNKHILKERLLMKDYKELMEIINK